MNNLLNEDQLKILSFKEEESNKVSALRKVFSSLAFKIMMCIFLCALATSTAAVVVNSVTMEGFSNNDIGTLIISCLMDMVLPLLFLRLLYLSYKVAKGKGNKKYRNSLIGRILAIRKFAKIFLIIMAACCIFDGLYMMNIESLYYSNVESFQQMGIAYTKEELYSFTLIGRNMLYQGIVFAFLAYGCLKAFKVMFKNILFDEKDNKLVELYIVMGLVAVYGLLLILGNVLALAGVETFLVSGLLNPKSVGSWLSFGSYIILAVTLGFGCYVIYHIRKALVDNNGSSNPLAQEVVYTVSEEDITEKKD